MILKSHERLMLQVLDDVAPPGFPGTLSIFSRVVTHRAVPLLMHRPKSSQPPFRSFGVPRLVLFEVELNGTKYKKAHQSTLLLDRQTASEHGQFETLGSSKLKGFASLGCQSFSTGRCGILECCSSPTFQHISSQFLDVLREWHFANVLRENCFGHAYACTSDSV